MAGPTLISEAVLHQWGDQGSSSVRSQLQTALKALGSAANASSAVPSEHPTLYRLLYELLWIVLQAKLSRQDVLTLFNEVNLAKSEASGDMLVDLLWVVSNEVEAKEKGRERYSSSEWQTLTRFVRDLAEEEIVPALTLKTALEGDLLHHAGLLGEPAMMMKKVVRVNTKTYYTQVKFNLLREESEGFAKVLTLLHTGITKDQIAASKTDLMSLIGYFDLDANRVLDLVLDAYETQPQNKWFVELLELFKRDSIPHVLGFKFQFYKRESTDELATPKSLYRLAATLIDKKLLDVEALMPHLSPSMEETVEIALEKAKEQEKAAKAFGKVNLAAKSEPDLEKEKAEALEAAAQQKKNEDNQVFGLVMGMLEVGSPARAFEMIKWFKERGVDALTHKALMMQMCDFVHQLLTDLYEPLSLNKVALMSPPSSSTDARKSSTSTQIKPYAADENWLKPLLSILAVLGGNLHNDAFLFTKVLRIVNHHVEKANKDIGSDEVSTLVKKLMLESFLPALSLQSCSPSTAFQLWDLLKNFSFDERYRLYQQWEELYSINPALQLVEAQCIQGTRRVMRRLTADRAKSSARSLTHIAHSNPLVVFRTMLRQIQSYDNLIQPVVESLKFVTPFGMDVLSFVLVSELSKSRQSMKSDGTNISLWLASLANFSGSFYRKYPNVELGGLLQYLIQRLQNWESVDLVVLSELLSKMGSCITFEDISISQLEAQAGGPHLWQEQTDPKLTNRRAIPRLRDALIKRNLALPLCLLICQVRSKMEFQEDSSLSHLKTLGRMFDTSQMTLSQLLQFLNGVVDPVVYTKMLPSVSELVKEYHILPELAMTICRPAIRCEDAIFKKTPRSIHSSSGASSDAQSEGSSSWDMQSAGLLEDVGSAVTSVDPSTDPFKGMSKEFYVIFWSMILYDIHVPFPQYEAEISRLRGSVSSQSAATNMTPSERKKLKEKTTQMIDKLVHEQKDQVAHRKRVYERLEEQKARFFMNEEVDNQTAVSEVLQKCIIPRALLSPEDALFCAKFMERLHHINTPQFSTVQYYSKATLQLPSIVLCVTEREAGNFGIFLKETMALLLRWYQSSVTYDEEAIHGKSGFSVDLRNPANVLTHRQYKSMYAKCHRSMVHLYSKALSSGEYMPIRNSLIVLTKVIDVFPSGKTAAECLLEIVQVLTEEDREDIKIMARRYFALLTKRKSSLVDDKMLAVGLSAPKKVIDTGSKSSKSAEITEELEGDSRKKSDRDSNDRDAREASQSNSTRSGRDNATSGRGDRPRGDSVSLDDPLETGEVKGENSSSRGDRVPPSASSKLKRRDSERERGDERTQGDNRRDRRGPVEREQSGTPQRTSSSKDTDGGRRSAQETTEKRDGFSTSRENQRRSRSRSSERRSQRDREREKPAESKELPGPSGKRDSPEANSRSSSTQDDAQSADNRKRQRVESTEAALRRQLTEKRSQDQRKSRDESVDTSRSTSDQPSRRDNDRTTDRRNEDREITGNSSRPTGGKPDGNNDPTAKKIVSLVSSSRKRDRDAADSDPHSSTDRNGRTSDDNGSSGQDAKRRREGGGGGGGRDEGNNRPGRGDQQQQNRRNGDDRRKQQAQQQQQPRGNNQPKQKNEGGSQQRDPSRSNRPDQRGGGGQNRGSSGDGDIRNGKGGNERRRDSNANNVGDRRRR